MDILRRRHRTWAVVGATLLTLSGGIGAHAQTWETAANHPGDETYFDPPYPIVFVAARIHEVPSGGGIDGNYHIGTDVLSANNPDQGHELWIAMPGGTPKKLFPLPAHVPLIDTPPGDLSRGSVVEPNVSEDGTKIYFSYFHDTTFESSFSFGLNRLPFKGADLYALDLSPLLANPSVDPATLPVTRLTTRVYAGNGQQTNADKYKDAMNPALATSGVSDWGTVYMHPVEMRTAHGLSLVYVSDERRVRNSNQSMSIGYGNHNFNLHVADIEPDGTLANPRQLQYYTTTSALSPTPLRNGIAYSYQASTADARTWHIQGIDSAGRWYPIIGYGINPELFHLGAFCVNTKGTHHLPGDYFVGTRYYNANNEGFGALWAQDLGIVGVNEYDVQTFWGVLPRQVGSYKLTQQVNSNDYPASKIGGQYVGKMTTPRCGRPDELYMAYSPTSANGRLLDPDGNRDIYHSYIAFRPNLEPFSPLDPVDVAAEEGLRIVVDDSSDAYTLVWPVPLLSWQQRTGDAAQEFSPFIADPATTIAPGVPHARVGTSALYNTDRKPFDCWLGPMAQQNPYSPNKAYVNVNQENDLIVNNTDGLTYVQNQTDYCEPLDPAHVLGVSLYLTSNKTNMSHGFNPGYRTDGNGRKEAAKHLGVYDVRSQADQSFMATIPAHAPFELHLLHKDYGMKLVDVRSWHSLQPRETRNDCGGCHQHEPSQGIPFAGTVADQQPPLDLVNQTPYLTYDADCLPVLQTSGAAALDIPEWSADIWPGVQQYCGSCHANGSGNGAALAAFNYGGNEDAYNKLKNRNFADTKVGALGSPAFWAARGERTDGRDNDLPQYAPDYSSGVWGYRFSAIHSVNPGLCSQGDPAAAAWVYRLGQWIDNHLPRDTGANYGLKHDWYHPSVDGAISTADCAPSQLRVGYWDDTGILARIEVRVNGTPVTTLTDEPNGSTLVSLPAVGPDDAVEVTAYDATNNRQKYEKSIGQLISECEGAPPATPTPLATATATAPGTTPTTVAPTATPTVGATSVASPTPVGTITPVPTTTPTPTAGDPCVGDPGCRRCRHTISKETSRLLHARVAALARCEDRKVQDKGHTLHPPFSNCATEHKTATRIARAEAKFEARIGAACGGADRQCGGDTAGEIGAQAELGWPATCPNLLNGPCTNAIGSATCTGVTTCIGCIAEQAVGDAMSLYYDMLAPSEPRTELNVCQRTIGRATSRFLLAKEKALATCWKSRLKGEHDGTCPDERALRKIQAAEERKVQRLCRACGGNDGRCDDDVTTPSGTVIPGSGAGDDLSVDNIGFVPLCNRIKVPNGPVCLGAVTTLADVVDCVDCVTEFEVDCVDRARVQGVAKYPWECSP